MLQAAGRGALGSALAQGIGDAIGVHDKFSWAGVAAAGVGAALGQWAGEQMPGHAVYEANGSILDGNEATWYNTAASSGAAMIANAATRSLIEGTDFGDNVSAALPDVIGQTIGNAIAGGIAGGGATTARSGGSIFGAIGNGLKAVGDFLGFDGSFGYDGTRPITMPGDIAPTWRGGRSAPIEVGILPDLPGYPTNPAHVLHSFFGGLGQNDIVDTASLTQYFADQGGLARIGPMMGGRGFNTNWGFVVTPAALELLRQQTSGAVARSAGGAVLSGGAVIALELTAAIGVPVAMIAAGGGAVYLGINHAAGLYERAASGGRIAADGSAVIVYPFGGADELQLLGVSADAVSFDDPLNGIEIRGPDEADFARDLASRGYSGSEIQSRLSEFRRSGWSGVFGQGPLGRSTLNGLVSDATMNPDSTTLVLGRWREDNQRYTDVAAHFGTTYYKMENGVYFALTGEQRWQVNQAFLDRQISQGKDIILSHDPTRASPTSTFGREVQYLRDYGYEFHQDSWFWRGRLRDSPQ